MYFRNLYLWLRGIRWLWTHRFPNPQGRFVKQQITYKVGWGPWKFLPVYLTTYLAGTLLGYGVVSLSRAWYDRSLLQDMVTILYFEHRHPFARFMTRALDLAFPGSAHGRHTGPRLWGSVNLRDP